MVISLAMNESRFGASPAARAAATRAVRDAHLYPDVTYRALRESLAAHQGVDPESIVLGNGSEELIELVVRAFAPPGSEVVFPRFSYILFGQAAERNGAQVVETLDSGLGADVDKLLEAVTERTRLVLLAEPNNPTGTSVTPGELARLARGLPERIWLGLDAAYAEYLPDHHQDAIRAVQGLRERVVTLRTFSKAYGLAGLRLGWCVAPAQAATRLNSARNLSNVNRVAAAAGAAALEDRAFLASVRRRNSRNRGALHDGLLHRGIDATPSAASFIAADFGSGPAATLAQDSLLRDGFRVRPLLDYGLPNHLRIGVGTAQDVASVLALLEPTRPRGDQGNAAHSAATS